MIRNRFPAVIWILFFSFIFTGLLYNSYSYLDNDLGWHLKVGQEIWHNRHVPTYDNYNYTLADKQWVDHEWLINLLCYLVYSAGGYHALTLVFACLALSVFLLLAYFLKQECLREKIGGNTIIMALLYLGLVGMSPHLGIRMQEVTILFFLLTLIIIYYYDQRGNYRILYGLPPLFCLWANLHGGFLIGFFLLGFWLAVKITERILAKSPRLSRFATDQSAANKKLAVFFLFCLLSALATLVNPYGLKLYSFLTDYANTYYLTAIAEWLPFYYLPIQHWQILYAAIIAACGMLYIFAVYGKQRDDTGRPYRFDLWTLLPVLVFLLMALKSKRHFPLFFIVSLPFAAYFLKSFIFVPPGWHRYFLGSRIIRVYVSAVFLLLAANNLVTAKIVNDPFGLEGYFCATYPCQAIKLIKDDDNYSGKRLLNNYNWGGFLIWVWPEKKLFIDGRLPQYPYGGHTLLEEYHDFFYDDTLAGKLRDYNIELVLIEKPVELKLNWIEKYIFSLREEELNRKIRDNRLIIYLDKSPEWKKIYDDNLALVYVKL